MPSRRPPRRNVKPKPACSILRAMTETAPRVLAHRGASGYELENTLAAFRRAVAMNADGIELDVHATRDGALVVYHDADVPGLGPIAGLTMAELSRHRLANGEPIPSLKETLASLGVVTGLKSTCATGLAADGAASPSVHAWPRPASSMPQAVSSAPLSERAAKIFISYDLSVVARAQLWQGTAWTGASAHALYVVRAARFISGSVTPCGARPKRSAAALHAP